METGNPIIIRANDKEKDTFEKVQIGAGSEYDEKWLQDKIFNDIELLSITDPNLETIKIIPLCREFSMHDSLRNVFLDILAITEKGKLILIKKCKENWCKLTNNEITGWILFDNFWGKLPN